MVLVRKKCGLGMAPSDRASKRWHGRMPVACCLMRGGLSPVARSFVMASPLHMLCSSSRKAEADRIAAQPPHINAANGHSCLLTIERDHSIYTSCVIYYARLRRHLVANTF
jgi:hypothetical protein